jgi:copper chaperone CopZ
MKASAYFTLDDKVGGKHGVKTLKRELDALRGVISVAVNERDNRVAVDFDTTGENRDHLRETIERLGYTVTDTQLDKHIM